MWHAQRKPWTIISGAREGGIYKSTDGGDTWNKLAGGLPHELFGAANVAHLRVEAESHLRADRSQAGRGALPLRRRRRHVVAGQWAGQLITRPFYYDTLGVDPTNADVVYVGDESWFKSTDGGADVPHCAACRTATTTTCGSIRRTRRS